MAVWVVRGGQREDTLREFIRTGTVGIEYWTDEVNLMGLDKEALKEQIRRNYGKHIGSSKPPPRVVSYFANRIWEFLHDIQVGDRILLPVQQGNRAYVGYMAEGYACQEGEHLPHRRNVEWTDEMRDEPLGGLKNKRSAVFKLAG